MRAANILRAARAHAGLTQRALSVRAGVPQPTIAAIETGRQDPRYATLERLVRACGQDLDLMPAAGERVDRTQFPSTLPLSPAPPLAPAAAGAPTLPRLPAAPTGQNPPCQPPP